MHHPSASQSIASTHMFATSKLATRRRGKSGDGRATRQCMSCKLPCKSRLSQPLAPSPAMPPRVAAQGSILTYKTPVQ